MEKNTRPTQCDRLLNYLLKHETITPIEALSELSIFRLASRISELKKDYNIEKKMVEVTNKYGEKCRVAQYRLVVE